MFYKLFVRNYICKSSFIMLKRFAFLQQRGKRKHAYKALYMNVPSRYICVSQTQISFSRWTGNKLWYIGTMEYYSALKSDEPLIIEQHGCISISIIRLSEKSQASLSIYRMTQFIWNSRKCKTLVKENQRLPGAWGRRGKEEL